MTGRLSRPARRRLWLALSWLRSPNCTANVRPHSGHGKALVMFFLHGAFLFSHQAKHFAPPRIFSIKSIPWIARLICPAPALRAHLVGCGRPSWQLLRRLCSDGAVLLRSYCLRRALRKEVASGDHCQASWPHGQSSGAGNVSERYSGEGHLVFFQSCGGLSCLSRLLQGFYGVRTCDNILQFNLPSIQGPRLTAVLQR